MITSIDKAFARLAVLEFALGIEITNRLVHATPNNSQKYKEDFIRTFQSQLLDEKIMGGCEQAEADMINCLKEASEKFIQDIADHEALIRKTAGNI